MDLRRTIRIGDKVVERRHTGRAWDLSISVGRMDLHDVLLGLLLLHFGKIDSLAVEADKKVIIGLGRDLSCVSRDTNSYRVVLSKSDLEAVLSFLLEYERDGRAPVNHIDIESTAKERDDGAALIIRAEDSAPPLSADEARRALG